MSLFRADGRALLEIDDDGKGFDPAASKEKGQGLSNLEERANSLGGELEVVSATGDGTTIRVRVPL